MARGLHVREVLEYEIISDPLSREYVLDLQVISTWVYRCSKRKIFKLAVYVLRDTNVLNHVWLQNAVLVNFIIIGVLA